MAPGYGKEPAGHWKRVSTTRFSCGGLVEALEGHIPQGRLDEIWIPFPDPLPKNRQEKHRLLSPRFLKRYRYFARPGARIHLKTDDLELLDYAVETVEAAGGQVLVREQIDSDTPPSDLRRLETTYERRFRAEGRPIYYFCFCFD